MTPAIEELEKLVDSSRVIRVMTPRLGELEVYEILAGSLNALLPRLRTEERDGKRKAAIELVMAAWGKHFDDPAHMLAWAEAEAERRYP